MSTSINYCTYCKQVTKGATEKNEFTCFTCGHVCKDDPIKTSQERKPFEVANAFEMKPCVVCGDPSVAMYNMDNYCKPHWDEVRAQFQHKIEVKE